VKSRLYLNDLRAMDMPALNERLKEARTELFNLRFQAATGQLENHRQIRSVRRQIAQVLTVMQGRVLGFEQVIAAPRAQPVTAAPTKRRSRTKTDETLPSADGGETEAEANVAGEGPSSEEPEK